MSEVVQSSFRGGMNLLVDDTRLADNEYREAFNVRNRFDVLDQVLKPQVMYDAPTGKKQGIVTFGDYILLFSGGNAYYKFRDTTGWVLIQEFRMNPDAERYWFIAVPIGTTNYGRVLPAQGVPNGPINLTNVATTLGNLPGLLVQDGSNQPVFVFIDPNTATVKVRRTQTYDEWNYDATVIANDRREYVPVGTSMEWMDGILYIVSPDGSKIYRSVSGRPLDFVINVDTNGNKGGNAETTAYSVGVGGITVIKSLNNGSLFVSAGNAICFSVTINRTPNAPVLFGEPTFIRQFLFNAGCVNDRCIVDILGDTAFVDLEGLRSYNAVVQLQNEGRNSIFSLKVASLFRGLVQKSTTVAAITYDNYALFSVQTIYGYVIIVYDTLTQSFSCIDTQATDTQGVTHAIKQFAKIDTTTTRLYAITDDDRVLQLYSAPGDYMVSTVRYRSAVASATDNWGRIGTTLAQESVMESFRCSLSGFRQDSNVAIQPFVNNRVAGGIQMKKLKYVLPPTPYTSSPSFSDIDSQVANVFFATPNCNQGWKSFVVMSWTGGGSITNIETSLQDIRPKNPLTAQASNYRAS